MTDDGEQRTEDGEQMTEDRVQMTEKTEKDGNLSIFFI